MPRVWDAKKATIIGTTLVAQKAKLEHIYINLKEKQAIFI